MAKRFRALDHPAFVARLKECGAASDRVWLAALVIGIGSTLIAAYGDPYPQSFMGPFWAYAGLLVRVSLYLWAGDALRGRGGETLRRLFELGLVAGLFELLVDWWLVHGISQGRLVYLSGRDVVLLSSPVWMPVAWACVIVELGYPALRIFGFLRRRWRTGTAAAMASAVCGISAGLIVGLYEYFAYRAGWWKYEPARAMVGPFCALYIPLGEGLTFLSLLPIAARALAEERSRVAASIVAGGCFAAAIAVGYACAYGLLER